MSKVHQTLLIILFIASLVLMFCGGYIAGLSKDDIIIRMDMTDNVKESISIANNISASYNDEINYCKIELSICQYRLHEYMEQVINNDEG